MNKCTYIDGIASSQAIDTSGEIVSLGGLDTSSLVGAVLNWEHKSDSPSQICGKILKAHKIFSKEDCQDDRQSYFWNKYKIPFLYIMGRLFDDPKNPKPSAIEVASLFKDDADHPHETPVVGFSVEGARIPGAKEGMTVLRSIARKVTITNLPCNKTCIAEIMPSSKNNDKNSIESLFKGEMELFKFESTYEEILEKKENLEKGAKGNWEKEGYTLHHTHMPNNMHWIEAKDKHGNHVGAAELHPFENEGRLHPGQVYVEEPHQRKGIASAMYKLAENKTGLRVTPSHKQTESGKVFSQNRKSEMEKKEELKPLMKPYTSEAQRRWAHTAAGKEALGGETGVHEWDEATKGKKLPEKVSKSKDLKKGLPATGVGAGYEPSTGGGQGGGASGGGAFIGSQLAMSEKKDLKKALTAGSMNAAPGQLVGGAALGKEELKKDTAPPVPTPSPSPAPVTAAGIQSGFNSALGLGSLKKKEKSHWYERADQAYNTWDKKNQFKDYMKKRMPHLAEGEIDSIGRVLALKKTVQAEGKLSKMYASYFNKSELSKGHPTTERAHEEKLFPQRNPSGHGGIAGKGAMGHGLGVHAEYDTRGQSMAGFRDDEHSKLSAPAKHDMSMADRKDIHRQKLGELKAMPSPNLPKSEEMTKSYEPDPATAKKSGYHPTKPGTEYIHGLPKGHPSLGEHKGHTFRKLSPPTKDHNFHTWAVKTPKGENYKVNLPAHTGGSREAIHEHINARTK